ncbi:hypothetical protein AAC03nite_20380 [Alicyclobacillus acidoterrestris]|nr:hypothetical protein AAC03nite_20380 [Alicyclobacillus acidoterrestris]
MGEPIKAEIPDNVGPLEWLTAVMVCMAHGYSAEEAQEVVKGAAEQMRSDTDGMGGGN